MKWQEIIEKLGVRKQTIDRYEIPVAHLVVDEEFSKNSKLYSEDYRGRAVRRLIDSKVPFVSEQNIFFNLLPEFLSAKCPYCKSEMRVSGGGGAGCRSMQAKSIDFICPKCNSLITLDCSPEAISFEPGDGLRGKE